MNTDSAKEREPSIHPDLAAQLASIKKKLRHIERATNFYALPSLLFILLFALPLIGNIAAPAVGAWMGCSFGEGEARNCPVFGRELAEVFYEYAISIFAFGIFNPWLFFRAMSIILTPVVSTIWIVSIIWLYALRYKLRRRLWLTRVFFGRMPPVNTNQSE
jgi:hypothetical protein